MGEHLFSTQTAGFMGVNLKQSQATRGRLASMEDDTQPGHLAPTERRRHELRCYVNDADRALIREAARDEGCTVSEYLRLSATHVAREMKGLEVYDERQLVGAILDQTDPADA